jgi:adenylate cyclase
LGIGVQYQLEGKQSRFLRKAFQSYVSPQVVDRLVSQPELLALNGEKRELSMFFSDVEGFTTLAERLDPSMLVPVLNEYLSLMSRLIQESGGTVDKYVGDAVVAFWNAPMPVGDHALRAVQTAIRCQQKLAELAPHFQEEYGTSLRTRIGVNTALVTVGNFGSEDRFTFTMIGDGVNLASRIESINKVFGTRLLITDATESLLSNKVRSRLVGKIRVAGKKEAVKIYEPYLDDAQWIFADERLPKFSQAMSAFENGNWAAAAPLFEQLKSDPVSKVYAERIRLLLQEDTKPEDWSPIWEFSEK